MDPNGEIMYALKYAGAVCKMVPSSEMIAKCPEKLVPFLESMIVFNWRGRSTSINAVDVGNYAYISACTNNGGGIKYLLSRNDNRFLHVATSNNMINHAPDVVVRFLESKFDFNDTGHPLPQTRNFSKFFAFSKYISILLQNFDISTQYLNFSALRSFEKSIANLNIKVFPKIKVQRDLDLERYLIIDPPANQPAQANVRQPTQANVLQPAQSNVRQPVKKNKTTISIGARGRKRKTTQMFRYSCQSRWS